jgi:hypothetical protein
MSVFFGVVLIVCLTWILLVVNRKTLIFEGPSGAPLVLYATHAKRLLQLKFEVILAEIQALFPGELYPVDSTSKDYSFLALHFGVYNKYSEDVCSYFFPSCTLLMLNAGIGAW